MDLQVPPIEWFPVERAAWAPPEDVTVSQWAAKYRVLPKHSARPGPWNNRLAPYTVAVMDAFNDPQVERITIMASVQSSKTESVYNMLGYAISQDPAPALMVMPTLETLKRVNKRIQQMIFESPELAGHLTPDPDDLKQKLISLDRMEIYFVTAGSAADLRNVEARYVFMDETDDYPAGTGDQGSPIEMAEARATTFWNRKIITLCTPTMEEGYINIEYERSDKRKFWVPCPHCHGYQVLDFWQVKHQGEKRGEWPKDKQDPEYIKAHRVARYECRHCGEEIDDKDKPGLLSRGRWVPDGIPVSQDGTLPPLPVTAHMGFWWNALYSPWRTFSEVAAQFFATKDDREKYKTFVNLWMAQPWKEVVASRQGSEILELRTALPPLVVPEDTVALTAGIDSQKRGFWIVIRAWLLNPDPESHLIRYAYVEGFEDLERWLFQDIYYTASGLDYRVMRAGIDIGGGEGELGEPTMTAQIYDWLRRAGQGRVFGVKGLARALPGSKKMKSSIIDRMPGRGRPIPGGITLWSLDTDALKDSIWSRIESGKFHLHAETDEVYASHLSAEAKERDAKGRWTWIQQGRRPNHLWDCEVYAAAMADPECLGGIMVVPRRTKPFQENKTDDVNRFTGQPRGSWLRR